MTVKKFIGVLPILAASLIFLVIAVKSPKQAAQMAVSDNVVCSEEQAFLAGDPFLELSCAGAYPIYYTLDGSIPTLDSMLYEAPITLSASDEVQSVVVRAGAYDENTGEWGDLFTHTYFYANDLQTIRERYSTYIVCVTSDPYNLYDYEYGILTEGKVRDEYVASDSYDENLLLMPANYTQRGSDWERDAHLEILNADGERLIDQDMGLRVFGNASRQAYRKSMKFYAREEYGADSFDYPLFSENVSVKSGTVQDSYKHLIVRNHGNDRSITLFREELFQTLCSRIDGTDTKSFAPAAVYLNGEYYNFEWLQEVYDDLYMSENYGTAGDGYYEVATVWLHDGEASTEKELKAQQDYEDLQLYAEKDLTNDENFEEFCQIMDVDNMLQYYAVEAYIANWDWAHNRKLYRYVGSKVTNETDRQDGRWRFLYYDMEVGFNIYNEPEDKWESLQDFLETDKLLAAVLQREDMQQKFADYLNLCIEDYFSEENVRAAIEMLQNERDQELQACIEYKQSHEESYTLNMEEIDQNIDVIYDFVEKRPEMIREQVQELFGISIE